MPQIGPGQRAASFAAILFALAALAACTDGEFSGGPAVDLGLDLVGLGEEEAQPPAPALSIGAPLIVGYNAIRVALPGTGTSGQSQTFAAPDGAQIAMNSGHVTRVIGLGVDLQGMFLPVTPYAKGFVRAAQEGAITERVADYFKEGRIVHDIFRCSLVYVPSEGAKGVITEQCRRFFGGPGFRNTYWTEENRIICSLQWFHPEADFLQFFETEQQAQTLDLNRQGC